VRGNYRGKYGFLDTDNNGFIDPFDVYVKGYFLLNAAIQKNY
jgi:outer membrane receptor for ferrienterochelin and colicins